MKSFIPILTETKIINNDVTENINISPGRFYYQKLFGNYYDLCWDLGLLKRFDKLPKNKIEENIEEGYEIVSVGGSSGGAIAATLWASPTLENTKDYIGVNFDGVVTSKHGGWDPTQAIDDDLDKIFAAWGADAYDRFVNFVAESRSQSYEDIKKIAGGRVWIATSAKEIGLIDEIGGIDDAIAYAANIADLEEYQVEYYGQKLSPEELLIKELLENFDISIADPRVISALDGLTNLYDTLVEIQYPKALFTCKDCMIDLN